MIVADAGDSAHDPASEPVSAIGIFRQLHALSNVRPLPEDRRDQVTISIRRLRDALSIRLGGVMFGTN